MAKAKILVVEDERALRDLYAQKFRLAEFEVAVAENGAIGLEVCRAVLPDIILLDIRMPVMTGDEMLEQLRQTDWGASIRVVILTNISRDEAPAKLRQLGVDRYVVKAHHTPAQVLNVVSSVLGLPKQK